MKQLQKTSLGFTLIELIVVITVILIVSAITILNFNAYTDRQRIKQAAITLRSDLRFARINASSGQKPRECTEIFAGYDVTFTIDCGGKGSCYAISGACYDPVARSYSFVDTNTIYLPEGVVFDGNYDTFRFLPLTGVTDLTGDLAIILSGVAGKHTICVTTSGIVSDVPGENTCL